MDNSHQKLLRPFFLEGKSRRKLVEKDRIFIKDAKNADLKTFFFNTVKNLKIPECEEIKPFA